MSSSLWTLASRLLTQILVVEALSTLKVNTILGDRLDLSYSGRTERNKDGVLEHVVRTTSGREVRASLVVSPTQKFQCSIDTDLP